MRRRFRVAPTFIAIVEFQKATGMAHLHIVIDRYIEQAWIKASWGAVGGGQHVDIRHIEAHGAAAYLSKYLSKDLLLYAPQGLRRISTSRSIQLNDVKRLDAKWDLIRTGIDRLYLAHRTFTTAEVYCEGDLESFVLIE